MDTKIIEYVIAIAEEKSLSKAAERLYLSQPALSQRLKKLEDELQPLLEKQSANAGQKYLTLCLRHLIRHRMHPYIS